MAWRIADSIVRGEIDNRQKGQVVGSIWLLGCDTPIRINLQGNCLPDLAGCMLHFSNPVAKSGDPVNLHADQDGVVGDITASRKVYVLDVSVEESVRLAREGKDVPKHHANCLYIEWFSRRNGRVVIETADFDVRVSEPAWSMTAAEHGEQVESTHEMFRTWLDESDRLDMEMGTDDEKPMDEFQWEKFMRDSDQKSEKLGEIMEKYDGHPDCDRLVAREMGWTWLEEELEAQERGIITSEDDGDGLIDLPEPDPCSEGIDWVRTSDGEIHHPLALQASDLSFRMWQACEDGSLLGEEPDPDASEMTSQIQVAAAKLAGGLHGIVYDRIVDSGFVVACLKRALHYLHQSLDATNRVRRRQLMDDALVGQFHGEVFDVREKILGLMKEHRQKMSHQ